MKTLAKKGSPGSKQVACKIAVSSRFSGYRMAARAGDGENPLQ
jgi:hypothetical protein